MALKKKKIWYMHEPLFNELKKEICYLCHKKIEDKDRIKVGKDLYRHKKCKPIQFENPITLQHKS